MKKSLALIFLIIHVFNLAGYPAIFSFLQENASRRFIVQIDNGEYSETQLVEVKIPYPLPYSTNWNSYERVNGEMEVNGIHYNYVKRKLQNDTLFLMCIPNQEKTKISIAKSNYFSVLNGVDDGKLNPGKKADTPKNSFQKSFVVEYNIIHSDYTLKAFYFMSGSDFKQIDSPVLSRTIASAFQPPEA